MNTTPTTARRRIIVSVPAVKKCCQYVHAVVGVPPTCGDCGQPLAKSELAAFTAAMVGDESCDTGRHIPSCCESCANR